jgi:uncharacterized protein YxeA
MKKIIIIFAVVLFVILAVVLKSKPILNNAIAPTKIEKNANSILETKENNDGSVSVSVSPRSFNDSSWDFDITLTTHSDELNSDLVEVSELVDDKEKVYRPTSWEGSPPGGHHREGVLKFNPISPRPKFITLKIKNVGGAPERSLEWDL